MTWITDLDDLADIYGTPGEASLIKVADHITVEYAAWINASRFCVLSTVGTDGVDGSPRGDDGSVVHCVDTNTMWMPDWRGNNRCDSLRNIVEDGRVSLMFVVRGSNTVIRVNGSARISIDPAILDTFDRNGHTPRSVIVIKVHEVYMQCARAFMRSGVWDGTDDSQDLPSVGRILAAQKEGFAADSYDKSWMDRAVQTLWGEAGGSTPNVP